MKALMTIDVEDWYQVENFKKLISFEDWEKKESRIETNINKILNLLEENKTKATFFVLGWIAERYPDIIKSIHKNGHEIASHGYGHELINKLSKEQYSIDVKRSKDILENLTGDEIFGYRAPSFSITDWAIDILCDAGYKYDASLFPFNLHDRYGKLNVKDDIIKPIIEIRPGFYEVMLSCLSVFKKNIPWAGGGYFRLIPYFIFRYGIKLIQNRENIYCFYIHPWEFDVKQPRLKSLDLFSKFRHYNHLKSTEHKYKKILKDFEFGNIRDFLKIN